MVVCCLLPAFSIFYRAKTPGIAVKCHRDTFALDLVRNNIRFATKHSCVISLSYVGFVLSLSAGGTSSLFY